MYIIVAVVIAEVAMDYFANFNPVTKQFVVNLAFAVCTITTISVYFGSKARLLLEGAEFDANMSIVKKSKVASKYAAKSEPSLSENNYANMKMVELANALEALQRGSSTSNKKLCTEQIALAIYRLEEDSKNFVRDWERVLNAIDSDRLLSILDSPVAYFHHYRVLQSTKQSD